MNQINKQMIDDAKIIRMGQYKNNNLTSNSFKQVSMSRSSSFDWYQLSRINQVNPKLQQFANLIRNSHFSQQLNKVPNSLRQKLLVTFQNASEKIKKQYFEQQKLIEQLNFNKRVIGEQTHAMKQQLQVSIKKINNDKVIIEQKKKISNKLKQKLKKKADGKQKQQKAQKPQSYFCPFCTRQDFPSRNEFTFHMFNEHSKNTADNQGITPQQVIPAQFKQLMLSLKDKQIQLMQMMLNKKKEMETMELEYVYSQQLKKVKSQTNFAHRKSMYSSLDKKTNQEDGNEEEQLKGQSQYLFYQNPHPYGVQHSNQNIGMENYNYEQTRTANRVRSRFSDKINQFHDPIPRQTGYREDVKPRLIQNANEYRSPNPNNEYYHIFSDDIAVSQIDNSISSQKIQSEMINKPKTDHREQNPYTNRINRVENKVQHKSEININKSLSWQRSPIKPLQNHQTPVQSKLYTYNTHHMNIRKEDKTPVESTQRKYETVYMPSKSNVSKFTEGHIFNSGPLLDDASGQSDYEDYFANKGQQQSGDQIQDQQIRIVFKPSVVYNKSSRSISREGSKSKSKKHSMQSPQISISKASHEMNPMNNHSNILEYSKDKSLLEMSESKQKSSDLIQLSNSFSKKALQSSSNNNQSINLSDLKLSKLERQKQKERQEKKKQEENQRFFKKPDPQQSRTIMNNFPMATYDRSNSSKSSSSVLEQFKRESDMELKMQRMAITKTQKPMSGEPAINFNRLKMPQNMELMKTNPGVLEEFLYQPIN